MADEGVADHYQVLEELGRECALRCCPALERGKLTLTQAVVLAWSTRPLRRRQGRQLRSNMYGGFLSFSSSVKHVSAVLWY